MIGHAAACAYARDSGYTRALAHTLACARALGRAVAIGGVGLAGACGEPPRPVEEGGRAGAAQEPAASRDPGPVGVPGTAVTLDPPRGFELATTFAGIRSEDGRATLHVLELPTHAGRLRASFEGDALAEKGMELVDSRSLSIDGRDALVVEVRQTIDDARLAKWMAAVEGESGSLLLVASCEAGEVARLGEPLVAALEGARWSPVAREDVFADLGFTLSGSPLLPEARRVGDFVALEEPVPDDPSEAPRAGAEALVLARATPLAEPIEDLEAFARARLEATAAVDELAQVVARTVELGELPACEILARATAGDTGTPLQLWQVVAVDETTCYALQGQVSVDRATTFVPEFRAIAESFRRTP